MPELRIESDYDGYFEDLVRSWIESKKEAGAAFNNDVIVVTSGPYRMYAVAFERNVETKTISFDFYSAYRNGFGLLGDDEIRQIIELL